MGIGSVIGGVTTSLVMKVAGGVILALVVFAGVQTWRVSHWRTEARHAQKEVGAVEQRLKTANASIATLEAIIEGHNAVAREQAKELDRSRKLAAQQDARFDKLAKANGRRIVHLNEMAEKLSSDCTVPPELLAALRGL